MYNGWKNYQTWNVALWVNNDEWLYNLAVEYVRTRKKPTQYGFICWSGLIYDKTPDGIKYLSTKISRRELNRILQEMKEELNEL